MQNVQVVGIGIGLGTAATADSDRQGMRLPKYDRHRRTRLRVSRTRWLWIGLPSMQPRDRARLRLRASRASVTKGDVMRQREIRKLKLQDRAARLRALQARFRRRCGVLASEANVGTNYNPGRFRTSFAPDIAVPDALRTWEFVESELMNQ